MKLLIEFLREKHEQRNPEDVEAKSLNEYICECVLSFQVSEVCCQVLINIWKNTSIPSLRIPNRVLGIRDYFYLKAEIREFKLRRERDAGLLLILHTDLKISKL